MAVWIWPLACLSLMLLSLLGIGVSLGLLGQGGVHGSFLLSAWSFMGLVAGIAGLIWGAALDALRRSLPASERLLYLGLIFFLVPVGAIVYYGLVVRSSPTSSPS